MDILLVFPLFYSLRVFACNLRPITKTRGFKIGSDVSLCNVVIDSSNADPVHLVLVNEPDMALVIRNNKQRKIPSTASAPSTLPSANSEAARTCSTGSSRTSSSRSRALANQINNSLVNTASNDAVVAAVAEPASVLNVPPNRQHEAIHGMEIDPASTLSLPVTSTSSLAHGETAMQVDGSISETPVPPCANDVPMPPAQSHQETYECTAQPAQDVRKAPSPSILSPDHLGNQWYIQVVGRTGVYINNFYHGCVSSKSGGSDPASSSSSNSSSSSDSAVLVPIKSGDELRVGDWLGSVYFT